MTCDSKVSQFWLTLEKIALRTHHSESSNFLILDNFPSFSHMGPRTLATAAISRHRHHDGLTREHQAAIIEPLRRQLVKNSTTVRRNHLAW